MTRRSLLAAPLAVCGQDPILRVDVQLIRVLANVQDTSNQLVGGLAKEDFSISDNGVPQEIAIFERSTTQVLNVAVLLDISASVAKDLHYETGASLRFARALIAEGNPEDSIALITFNHDVDLVAGFTRRIKRLENAVREIRTGAGTALYDAVYLAGEELEGRAGRKVIICVTDGGDTVSHLKFDGAMSAAQRAQAAVYAILVTPILSGSGRNQGGENALQLMAERTGGRVLQPTSYAKLGQSFDEILKDLRTQYLLAYYRKNVPTTKNKFHRLEVKSRRSGLRVSARTGYYEETL